MWWLGFPRAAIQCIVAPVCMLTCSGCGDRFEPPPRVVEVFDTQAPCDVTAGRFPLGRRFRFANDTRELSLRDDVEPFGSRAERHKRNLDLARFPWARDYVSSSSECLAENEREVRFAATSELGTLFVRTDTPRFRDLGVATDDEVEACIRLDPREAGCRVTVTPAVFEGRRRSLPRLLGLAHGYSESTLSFVAFAPEHLMDALCSELARLSGRSADSCVKTITPNNTAYEHWSP